MSHEQNKAVVRRFYEAFGKKDFAALEEVLAPDMKAYGHSATTPQSRDEMLQGIRNWNEAFSESFYTVEEQLAEGDRVATRVTFRSTHDLGDFMGLPPSGEQITIKGITIEQIKDGQIVERLISYDQMGILQQLGLVPAM